MSVVKDSDSSTSESEVSASSSNYDPLKALYSKKSKVPVKNAPMYENLQQFENAQKNLEIIPVGQGEAVKKREEAKEKARTEAAKLLEEKNKRRFVQYASKFLRLCFVNNIVFRTADMKMILLNCLIPQLYLIN